MTALLLSVAVNTALFGLLYHLSNENHKRIVDIQNSRVASCQQTYRAFPLAFAGLTPPSRSPADRRRVQRFNRNINHLVAGCSKQTQSRKEHP